MGDVSKKKDLPTIPCLLLATEYWPKLCSINVRFHGFYSRHKEVFGFFLLLVSLFPFPVSFALFLSSSLSCSQRDKTNGLEYDFPSS